jgi:hypothetical protein
VAQEETAAEAATVAAIGGKGGKKNRNNKQDKQRKPPHSGSPSVPLCWAHIRRPTTATNHVPGRKPKQPGRVQHYSHRASIQCSGLYWASRGPLGRFVKVSPNLTPNFSNLINYSVTITLAACFFLQTVVLANASLLAFGDYLFLLNIQIICFY